MRVRILSKSPSACSGARPESGPFGSELHQELGKEGQAPEPLPGGPLQGPAPPWGEQEGYQERKGGRGRQGLGGRL